MTSPDIEFDDPWTGKYAVTTYLDFRGEEGLGMVWSTTVFSTSYWASVLEEFYVNPSFLILDWWSPILWVGFTIVSLAQFDVGWIFVFPLYILSFVLRNFGFS